jgi:predicted RNA-binding Zn-ribbon protein involved in translation (DUF1610 family)
MMAPSAEELLRVWEESRRAHPVRGALLALAAASPGPGWDGWARAPIGERDGALLRLHEQLFGGELHTTATCPSCGERLESEFSAQDIRRREPAPPGAGGAALSLKGEGFDIEYRLPTSEDLLQIAAERSDSTSDAERLLRRCVSRARRGGRVQHDPDADVRVALACPACGNAWELLFDIVTYFWGELDDWAQRILADVHALARAYGWTEREILALSPARRQVYLDMVGA